MALLETTQSLIQKKENIRVAVRVRPLLPHETHKDEVVYYNPYDEGPLQTIKVADGQHMIESKYDKVFRQDSLQSEVFGFVKESIVDVLRGFNSTIFAYGQTGSGKTYTMFGPHWEDNNLGFQNTMGTNNFLDDHEKYGIIPKSIEHIFDSMEFKGDYTVYCSFMQIYNERLYDLFQDKEQSKPLVIREDKFAGIFVEGLSEYVVNNAQECFILLRRGEKNRITRQTKGNFHSSRSHTIYQLLVESNQADKRGMMLRGKLNLCDLAGSEKIGKEESLDQQHLLELKTINLSLTSLGKVISCLAQGKKAQHIPYRDSKITRLLQDSLGGNTKTTLIAAASPIVDNIDETISTLKFADRAKQIMVKISANEMNAADDAYINKLQKEVQHLKEILNLKRNGGANDVHQQLLQLKEENARLKEMAGKIGEVERLKQENKFMRIELQKLKVPSATQPDGFYQHQQQMQLSLVNNPHSQNAQLALRSNEDFLSENNQNFMHQQDPTQKQSFFLTESDYYHPKTTAKDQHNQKKISPMKVQQLSINDPHSMIFNNNPNKTQSIIDTPHSSLGMAGQDVMSTQSANTYIMSGNPFSNQSVDMGNMSVQQIADKLEHQRINELKNAALGMKGSLVQNGRCPKCTLKPPCKHFDKIDDLPQVTEVQPSLLKKTSQAAVNMPPLYPNNNQNLNMPAILKTGPQQIRTESEITRFTSASSGMQIFNNTPGGSTFQNSGQQIAQIQANNQMQQNLSQQQNNSTINQRVLQELNNYTPSTNNSQKSPFNKQSIPEHLTASAQSQVLQNGIHDSHTPLSHKQYSQSEDYRFKPHNPQSNRAYINTFYSSNPNNRQREISLNNQQIGDSILQQTTSNIMMTSQDGQQFHDNQLNESKSMRSRTHIDQRKNSSQTRQQSFFRLQQNMTTQNDNIQVRIRGKNNVVETKTGSVTRTLDELQHDEMRKREMTKTSERLKVLERLEKYREERLKREIEQFEEERKKEEEEIKKARDMELKRQKYFEKQKGQLGQLQVKKVNEERNKHKEIEGKKMKDIMLKKKQEQLLQEQKRKIIEYKLKKKQTEELLMNANYVDFEDIKDDEDLEEDELEGFVENLSNHGKRAPPAVK